MIKRLLYLILMPPTVFITGLLVPFVAIYWIVTGEFFKSPIEILEKILD